jgi:proteic killer suppression protein
VIKTFKDETTEHVFDGTKSKESRKFPSNLHAVAKRKLDYLNVAKKLEDLKIPPGNFLEALQKDLAGLHSVRINLQWRIVFRWKDGDCYEVRICDYHSN